MSFPRRRKVDAAPGVVLTVHRYRDRAGLAEVRDGMLVVIDRRDLDGETARELLDARPFGVLNAAEFTSGRFGNLGPGMLADRGIPLWEGDRDAVLALKDGAQVRLDRDALYDDAVVLLDLKPLSPDQVRTDRDEARAGLATQLASFAHGTSEFLRREEDLLLHGNGFPQTGLDVDGRAVLVVGASARAEDLRPLRTFLREQRPRLIAVDGGAEALIRRGLRPDLVILSGAGTVTPKTLARCREVVLTAPGETARRRAEQANLPVHQTSTSVTGIDLGLLLARRGGARLVVPVGHPGTLAEFLDRDRSSQASNVLTRMLVGGILVDAAAVPLLYTGRVRGWQVALLLLVAVGVLAVAVAATPTGQEWWDQLHPHLPWGLADVGAGG